MKKIILLAIAVISITSTFAQNIKIGVEGNFGQWQRYGNINATIYKGKWFVKPSIKYGNFGKNDSVGMTENPYFNVEMNTVKYDSNYYYTSFGSSSVNRGVSPEIKIGYTFGKEEKRSSFVVALSFAYYWIKDDYKRIYYGKHRSGSGQTDRAVVLPKKKVKHQNYSGGLSLYYGFKINEKLSLLAGLNLPYYQPIVSNHYDPNQYAHISGKPMMLNSLNGDYSIGINYKIK